MQINGEGLPTGAPPAGSGDPNPPANTGGQGDPAPTTGQQTPPAGDPPPGTGQPKDPEDLDGLKKSLEATRVEKRNADAKAREAQKKLDEAEKKLKEIDDSKKDELTKAQEQRDAEKQRADAAEARARTTALRFEITKHATAQNFHDPEDAYVHLIASSAKVEWNDEGEPQGVEQLVTALAKEKPHLLKTADGQQQQAATPQTPKPTPVGALTGTQTPPDVDEKRKQQQLQDTRNML